MLFNLFILVFIYTFNNLCYGKNGNRGNKNDNAHFNDYKYFYC